MTYLPYNQPPFTVTKTNITMFYTAVKSYMIFLNKINSNVYLILHTSMTFNNYLNWFVFTTKSIAPPQYSSDI